MVLLGLYSCMIERIWIFLPVFPNIEAKMVQKP
ncbi:hypothetical protein HmCmsJML020_02204 [Escherichia coli]|nr:hypothetical protein HmCmsJML020_02204 [Escherichia coli]